ncbi:hypothetical protein MMC28_001666 [Mycoblastus sanguinarius]|nr:hypothetical protein [Mycoblastus sanguinarius]
MHETAVPCYNAVPVSSCPPGRDASPTPASQATQLETSKPAQYSLPSAHNASSSHSSLGTTDIVLLVLGIICAVVAVAVFLGCVGKHQRRSSSRRPRIGSVSLGSRRHVPKPSKSTTESGGSSQPPSGGPVELENAQPPPERQPELDNTQSRANQPRPPRRQWWENVSDFPTTSLPSSIPSVPGDVQRGGNRRVQPAGQLSIVRPPGNSSSSISSFSNRPPKKGLPNDVQRGGKQPVRQSSQTNSAQRGGSQPARPVVGSNNTERQGSRPARQTSIHSSASRGADQPTRQPIDDGVPANPPAAVIQNPSAEADGDRAQLEDRTARRGDITFSYTLPFKTSGAIKGNRGHQQPTVETDDDSAL